MSATVLTETSAEPVLAIVVPDLFHASQTFFHEHIARIAPGRTVVLHLSATGAQAQTAVPVLELPAAKPWFGETLPVAGRFLRQVNVWRQNRLTRMQRRAAISFLIEHGVTHVLAEFATSGCVIRGVAKQLSLPLTVISHGWDINVVGHMPQWRMRYGRLFSSDSRLVAVCGFLRDRMVETGAPSSRIAVIPCAVEVEAVPNTALADQPIRCIMVSRLIAQKGPLQSLQSFAAARRSYPNLTLDIVGDGPLMADVQGEIERLRLRDHVTVHGASAHQRTLELMTRSHIFLQHCMTLPRQGIESQAVSLLEAMGLGLSPIVTRHGGMAEHIGDDERGWLVEEGDTECMAERIVHAALAPDKRLRIGKAARRYVQDNFSRSVVYPRLREVIGLDRVCKQAGDPK